MGIAQLYYPIYLLIVSVLTLSVYSRYNARRLAQTPYPQSKKWAADTPCLILALFMTLFIGFRPVSFKYFGDMGNYEQWYHLFYENVPFVYNPNAENFIWDNWWAWWGSMNMGTESFWIISAGIYFIGTWLFCKKVFPYDIYLTYLVFLAAFSTFSYTTNGCKAGNAATIFLLAIAYKKKLIISIPLLIVSLGFHHSMILPIIAYASVSFYKNSKFYLYLWLLCIIISLAHITWFQELFAQVSADNGDLHGANYLQGNDSNGWGGKSGFRYDFVLYSAMPVVVGFYAIFKKKIKSSTYQFVLNLYLLLNSVWMLCMYAEFTNRIAYLSWFMYPFVLIYPLLNENWGAYKYKTLSKVMLCHLGFTIFMQVIYY